MSMASLTPSGPLDLLPRGAAHAPPRATGATQRQPAADQQPQGEAHGDDVHDRPDDLKAATVVHVREGLGPEPGLVHAEKIEQRLPTLAHVEGREALGRQVRTELRFQADVELLPSLVSGVAIEGGEVIDHLEPRKRPADVLRVGGVDVVEVEHRFQERPGERQVEDPHPWPGDEVAQDAVHGHPSLDPRVHRRTHTHQHLGLRAKVGEDLRKQVHREVERGCVAGALHLGQEAVDQREVPRALVDAGGVLPQPRVPELKDRPRVIHLVS
mmetsp:Transcript_44757/g.130321  ORF Transcript_44757/g.130321 Transcript_44757/m.130321 type:complete len:270 (-) Transcript_44757:355-1164(-)